MTVETFPERVLEATAAIAADDRQRLVDFTAEGQLIAGQWVAELARTRMMLGNLGPAEWEHVAAFLRALLEREPVWSSKAYEAERILLGTLAWELRAYAASAGEPVGLQADLRAASSRQEEQRLTARLQASREAFHAHITDVIASGHAQRALEAVRAVEDLDTEPAAPVADVEIPSWL